ncbi:MAG: deoxyribodipyrimidine photolyase [Acidobacteria bacterium]|nr:MAG: deoxyribodipyrimidine photolyase [Acidobacteriota bacterium]REK01425.1 MAG: deoxyribodipyrimidine photolyase [Acidobacteriota bacterium]REK14381.1 MAG: deoxyribodipyrimidine photolyase [Acidobacteriota bacterium]REK45096.1 MAG: deoxyribodipyrimidine photolyase [Acidobacteriota bacterium]
MFPTDYEAVLERIDTIDPVSYGRTRNFVDGAVTKLSPYISRGVISTKQVLKRTLKRGYDPRKIKKFIQELAWRDYWQRVWISKGEGINSDLRSRQVAVNNLEMPSALVDAETGIEAVDRDIRELYETGYMHNHVRMYTASIACNIGLSHWKVPAGWMYFHLLDGDWASNTLSWQWVAGTNSHKKYFANQQNINRYCHTEQEDTFLDLGYDELSGTDVPERLLSTCLPILETKLPESRPPEIDQTRPTLIYTLYNLDPIWHKELDANRVLLFEPSHFKEYPVSANTIDFAVQLARNIDGVQIFSGEFSELQDAAGKSAIIFKEHPFARHFAGREEPRDWMFSLDGYFPSFSKFWRECERELTGQATLF